MTKTTNTVEDTDAIQWEDMVRHAASEAAICGFDLIQRIRGIGCQYSQFTMLKPDRECEYCAGAKHTLQIRQQMSQAAEDVAKAQTNNPWLVLAKRNLRNSPITDLTKAIAVAAGWRVLRLINWEAAQQTDRYDVVTILAAKAEIPHSLWEDYKVETPKWYAAEQQEQSYLYLDMLVPHGYIALDLLDRRLEISLGSEMTLLAADSNTLARYANIAQAWLTHNQA